MSVNLKAYHETDFEGVVYIMFYVLKILLVVNVSVIHELGEPELQLLTDLAHVILNCLLESP